MALPQSDEATPFKVMRRLIAQQISGLTYRIEETSLWRGSPNSDANPLQL